MLYEEAKWVGEKGLKHFDSGRMILNIGSSSRELREVAQPHMYEFIFKPLEEQDIDVTHTDIVDTDGVDLVGDLTDPEFITLLSNHTYDGAFCCNLLEHLEDRAPIIGAVSELLPVGSKLILTVPHNYPYHLDPIDTLYRPTVDELCQAFPQFKMIEGEILNGRRHLQSGGLTIYHVNYFQQLKSQPKLFMKLVARSFVPFYKPKMWWITVKDLCKMFRKFSVTCVVLEKK